jgi:hypothetical protein
MQYDHGTPPLFVSTIDTKQPEAQYHVSTLGMQSKKPPLCATAEGLEDQRIIGVIANREEHSLKGELKLEERQGRFAAIARSS